MKNLSEFKSRLDFFLTDIDDTLTDEGLLGPEAYTSIWNLHRSGIKVIPVTGRPAGWCELIARQWPVAGVIGENGGLYFRYDHKNKKMIRWYATDPKDQVLNKSKLALIEKEVFEKVPNSALASDQFCRVMDLAIDFCEDIPRLTEAQVDQIVKIFEAHGAQAKVSSIHVNGWFGTYDKVTTALYFLHQEFGLSESQALKICGFSGDSPNDEPMFRKFPASFAVANISEFLHKIKFQPNYVASRRGGLGFQEISQQILACRKPL